MPLLNCRIIIKPFAGYKIAYLIKPVFFGLVTLIIDEQLQMNEQDFEVVEYWMKRYGITAERFKDLTIKSKCA
jgi:hypothetical protein